MNPVIQFKATTLLPPIALLLACFAAVFILATNPASADELPAPGEPPLGSEYDDTVLACYNGSMTACDALWMDDRILMDSLLGKYGRTCGGRLERASQRQGNSCVEFFGHE
jgi:hypothetical protein